MVTLNEVYNAIKWMSAQGMNPRPLLMVNLLSSEMRCRREQLMPLLVELKNMRLIKFNDAAVESIKLTLLGNTVEHHRS